VKILDRRLPVINKKPYISSPFGWGLDGGSQRIYRAVKSVHLARSLSPDGRREGEGDYCSKQGLWNEKSPTWMTFHFNHSKLRFKNGLSFDRSGFFPFFFG
jgi:hypothetical protein